MKYLSDEPDAGAIEEASEEKEDLGQDARLAPVPQVEPAGVCTDDHAKDDDQLERAWHRLPVVGDQQ